MRASRGLAETMDCLCLASRRAARSITRAFDRELRAHGLRATQFTLLSTLHLKGEQSVGELAEFIGTDPTTMTRNVALAEEKALVSVRRDSSDARARIVAITSQGKTTLDAAYATWRRVQIELTEAIGQDAADRLRTLGRRRASPTTQAGATWDRSTL